MCAQPWVTTPCYAGVTRQNRLPLTTIFDTEWGVAAITLLACRRSISSRQTPVSPLPSPLLMAELIAPNSPRLAYCPSPASLPLQRCDGRGHPPLRGPPRHELGQDLADSTRDAARRVREGGRLVVPSGPPLSTQPSHRSPSFKARTTMRTHVVRARSAGVRPRELRWVLLGQRNTIRA